MCHTYGIYCECVPTSGLGGLVVESSASKNNKRWVVKGADLGPASELPHQSSILSKSPYRLPDLGSERAKYTCMLTVDWWW